MADPNSANELAPVHARIEPKAQTVRLAPMELVFATTIPGEEKIPEPTTLF
jgi:hypothetical protein